MGNCAAKKRNQARRQAAIERAGLASAGASSNFDTVSAGSDLSGALSGYGHGGHGGYGYGYVHEEECPEGVDEDLALALTGAAIAAGAYIVYRDITLRLPKRRRRSDPNDSLMPFMTDAAAWLGKRKGNGCGVSTAGRPQAPRGRKSADIFRY